MDYAEEPGIGWNFSHGFGRASDELILKNRSRWDAYVRNSDRLQTSYSR